MYLIFALSFSLLNHLSVFFLLVSVFLTAFYSFCRSRSFLFMFFSFCNCQSAFLLLSSIRLSFLSVFTFIFFQLPYLRNNHLTNSTWPNEYDQRIWTWPKRLHRQTFTIGTWQKMYDNDEHSQVNMTKIKKFHYFGQIHLFMFAILKIFFIYLFISQ